MVTSRDQTPRSWMSTMILSAVALALYSTLSLSGMTDGEWMLPAIVCFAGAARLGWQARRIGVWEQGVLSLALGSAGLLLAFDSTAWGWGLFGAAAVVCGTSLHLKWMTWEQRCR